MTHIRDMVEDDCAVITRAFEEQGWNKPVSQYQNYLCDSRAGSRVVLVAEQDGQFAGYLTVVWASYYEPFRAARVPEITDFNVLKKHRRLGIGTALMDEAERRISERASISGIGVGLTSDYGPAQILYSRRGYRPDGCGAVQNGRPLRHGDQILVDDGLALYLTKLLQ